MGLVKRDISRNISLKAQISSKLSKQLLDKFLETIRIESQSNSVKISNFGTFYFHKTPERIGRNPLTKEEFTIKKRSKLVFKASNNIKKFFN
jgi:nucleoid DNA-binding protein